MALKFFNHVHASHRLTHAWFLKIISVWTSVCACVCPPLRLLITSGVIWTPYAWLNKEYSFHMAGVIFIGGGHGLKIEAHCRNQPIKSCCYISPCTFAITFLLNSYTQATRWSASVIKVGVHGHARIKVFKRRAAWLRLSVLKITIES